MNPVLLIKLSENDKRVIIAIFLILILVFVLIGLIGSLIVRTMKWQGKKCDTLVSDVVRNHIVTTPLQLRNYARKKNTRYFIKQAWIPILLILESIISKSGVNCNEIIPRIFLAAISSRVVVP